MKKVLLITTLVSGLLTACADNSKNETVNSTDSIQTNSATSLDSTKAAEEKRVKDSADAAHGHSH